jgi:hypothetical protein
MNHISNDIISRVFGDCRYCPFFWAGAMGFDASLEDRCLAVPGQGCVPPVPPPEVLETMPPPDLGVFLVEQEEAQAAEAFTHLAVIAFPQRDRLQQAA